MILDSATLVREFQRMYQEHWSYVWGKHEEGTVDCSGAFYYVFKKYGLPMYNGSNRIARVYITGRLIPIAEARQNGLIVPGMAAFKHREPGQSGYSLGSGYQPGGANYNGDLNDYHHIGLVDQDVGYILNAQSAKTGFVRSKLDKKWTHVAFLKNVEYGVDTNVNDNIAGKDKTLMTTIMEVVRTSDTSPSSNTVNIRSSPSKTGKIVDKVDFGSTLSVDSTSGEWSHVDLGTNQGWMMSKYLKAVDEGTVSVVPDTDIFARLEKIYDELGDILGLRG